MKPTLDCRFYSANRTDGSVWRQIQKFPIGLLRREMHYGKLLTEKNVKKIENAKDEGGYGPQVEY